MGFIRIQPWQKQEEVTILIRQLEHERAQLAQVQHEQLIKDSAANSAPKEVSNFKGETDVTTLQTLQWRE